MSDVLKWITSRETKIHTPKKWIHDFAQHWKLPRIRNSSLRIIDQNKTKLFFSLKTKSSLNRLQYTSLFAHLWKYHHVGSMASLSLLAVPKKMVFVLILYQGAALQTGWMGSLVLIFSRHGAAVNGQLGLLTTTCGPHDYAATLISHQRRIEGRPKLVAGWAMPCRLGRWTKIW